MSWIPFLTTPLVLVSVLSPACCLSLVCVQCTSGVSSLFEVVSCCVHYAFTAPTRDVQPTSL